MKKLLLIVLLGVMTFNPGCSIFKEYVFVQKRLPIIPKPERPQMVALTKDDMGAMPDAIQMKVIQRDAALKKYAKKLEVGIDIYNEYARKTNDQSGLFDSLKDL